MKKFKDNYFSSGMIYHKNKGVYKLKNISILKKFIERRSKEHYRLILLEKWKLVKGANKVLDAGCGMGQFIEFNPYKIETFGIDIIDKEIKECVKKGLNVRYADITASIPFKDSYFDAIICSHVIEHIFDPEKTILEFKRVLKNNGSLVLAVPNFSFKGFYNDYTHKRPYPKEALYRLLRDYGFDSIKIRNGPTNSPIVSAVFLPFPKFRHEVEKFLGKFKPWEVLAISKNIKTIK